jgi:hypothetical protein
MDGSCEVMYCQGLVLQIGVWARGEQLHIVKEPAYYEMLQRALDLDLGIGGRIVLECILTDIGWEMWTGFI